MPLSLSSVFKPARAGGLPQGGATWALLAALGINFVFATGHDEQRAVQCVLLACLGLFAVAGRRQLPWTAAWSGPAGLALAAFFLLGAASALSALSLRHAVFEWSSWLLLFMVAASVANEVARCGTAGLKACLQVLGVLCALHACRVLLVYVAALASGIPVDMHGLAVGFSNVRFLNHVQTALLPLIVLLCLQAPAATAARRAWFALAAFWWALLFVGEARATLLALGAGCALVLLLRRAHARAFLQAMALTALAGLAVYVLAFIVLPMLAGLAPIGVPSNVLARTAADPSSGRNLLWKLASHLIASHPWLGVGPQHFAHEGASLAIGAHPHDWLLQVGAEWGIPALLCLLTALALGARGLLRSGARIASGKVADQQILVALLASCGAICVDGLFSGVLVMPQSQLAIAFVIGCANGWVRSLDGGVAPAMPGAAARWSAALLTAAALCALAWSVAPDFLRHASGAGFTPAEQAVNGSVHWPRLWETGYF